MRKMTNERIRVEILIQENIVPQLNALAKHLQDWGNESNLASMKLDKIINDLNNILNENAK